MGGGRTREKSLCFRDSCIKHLHAHIFHVKNPNKKNIFPQSLLRSEINHSVQAGMPSSATAQLKVHTLVLHCLQGVTTEKLFQPTLAKSHPKLLLMRCKVTNLSPWWARACFVFLETWFCCKSVKREKLTPQLSERVNWCSPWWKLVFLTTQKWIVFKFKHPYQYLLLAN